MGFSHELVNYLKLNEWASVQGSFHAAIKFCLFYTYWDSAILKNISQLLLSCQKLPDKANRDDRNKASENTIHLNHGV